MYERSNAYLLEWAIDWKIMKATYWSDTPEDGDRRRRRQAEFLVHQFCPWKVITEIGVINNTVQSQVQQILQNFNQKLPIKVYSSWYY
jgi:ssDNA thymidine ADP-ribosyltransferase, DarT